MNHPKKNDDIDIGFETLRKNLRGQWSYFRWSYLRTCTVLGLESKAVGPLQTLGSSLPDHRSLEDKLNHVSLTRRPPVGAPDPQGEFERSTLKE